MRINELNNDSEKFYKRNKKGFLFLIFYRSLMILLLPLWKIFFQMRVVKKSEDKSRLKERWGIPGVCRPTKKIVWVHGASIGEAKAALGIIHRILESYPEISVLITTQTRSSAQILKPFLSDRLLHQMIPLDVSIYAKKFFKYWRPCVGLFIESDLWPSLLYQAQRSKCPLFLVNGKLSEKSFRKWLVVRSLLQSMFMAFKYCFVSSLISKKRLSFFCNIPIKHTPSLKYTALASMYEESMLNILKEELKKRPFFLASCIHEEEETLLWEIFKQLRRKFPDLLLVWAPRHLRRVDKILEHAKEKNFKIERRTQKPLPSNNANIYLVDTFGELGLFYALSPFCLLGGSFCSAEGHNVLEPILLNCAVVHGPNMKNQEDVSEIFDNQGACLNVSRDRVVSVLENLLKDPTFSEEIVQKASFALKETQQEVENFFSMLMELLKEEIEKK